MKAHFPPFQPQDSEWITPAAGVTKYGLPLELIHGAMLRGDLTVRSAAGETVLLRHEVKALRLRLMAGRCACEE